MVKNLTGKKFGRLTVITRAQDIVSENGYHTVMWVCKCDCGKEVTVRAKSLTCGVTKSCGCLRTEMLSDKYTVHGEYGTRLNNIWNSMRQRCNNQNNRAYANYGGRGIKVCEEWNEFINFKKWADESGYDDTLTLDRIDVDGDYSPNNCKWSTMKEQQNNKRSTILITYNNVTHSLSEWSDILGVKYCTLWKRYKRGLTEEKILSVK